MYKRQGEYGYQKANLKAFIDTIATKPYDIIVGHNLSLIHI